MYNLSPSVAVCRIIKLYECFQQCLASAALRSIPAFDVEREANESMGGDHRIVLFRGSFSYYARMVCRVRSWYCANRSEGRLRGIGRYHSDACRDWVRNRRPAMLAREGWIMGVAPTDCRLSCAVVLGDYIPVLMLMGAETKSHRAYAHRRQVIIFLPVV